MKNIIGIIALSFVLISFLEANAQQDRREFRERIEKVRKERLIEEVKLSEQEAQKFIDLSSEHRKNMRELFRKRRNIEDQFVPTSGSSELERLLSEYLKIDVEIASERQRYFSELKSFLSINRIAEVISFQSKFDNSLKREFRKKSGNKDRRRR